MVLILVAWKSKSLWRSLVVSKFELLSNGKPMIAVEYNKMALSFVKTHLKNWKMGRKKKDFGSGDISSHCDIAGKTHGFLTIFEHSIMIFPTPPPSEDFLSFLFSYKLI